MGFKSIFVLKKMQNLNIILFCKSASLKTQS